MYTKAYVQNIYMASPDNYMLLHNTNKQMDTRRYIVSSKHR